ncbi:MAG: hypothetical protein PHI31_11310 [Desulfuromonadaceae bacterium]|nr:hypothetical protein [Desulfuromonadaceae bacterium]
MVLKQTESNPVRPDRGEDMGEGEGYASTSIGTPGRRRNHQTITFR